MTMATGVKGVEGVDVIKADEAGGDDVDVIEADEAGGDDVDDDASSIDSGVLPEDAAAKDGVDPTADLEAVLEKTIKECECELAGVDLELAKAPAPTLEPSHHFPLDGELCWCWIDRSDGRVPILYVIN